MPSTVLSVLQSAAYELGIPPPSAYSSNSKLLYLLYAVNRRLRKARAFPQQKRTHTITFTAGRDKYPVPGDFYSGLLSTQYDRTNSWALVGPMSDGEWNFRLYAPGSDVTSRKAFRVFGPDFNQGSATAGGQIQINPTPQASDVIGFDYISRTTILPPAWTASSAVTINHYRNANGSIYQATVGGTTGTTPPSHTSGTATDGTVTWTYISEPKETATVDGDLCLFDDDTVIEGLKYLYRESSGLQFQEPMAAFQSAIDNAVARWGGSQILRLDSGRDYRGPRYAVPDGGWSF